MPEPGGRPVLVRLAGIEPESIVDGPGLRYVVFTQGCPHHCPGCHNPHTHSPDGGIVRDIRDIFDEYGQNPLLAGMTFSGGEPFMQAAALSVLARLVHESGGDVVTYTGYSYEQLRRMDSDESIRNLLEQTDLLIDGPYVEALRDLDLAFCGSSNQRLLDRTARLALDRKSVPQYQC